LILDTIAGHMLT